MLSPLLGSVIITAILVWQLGILNPGQWCGVAVGSAKVAGAVAGGTSGDIRACFDLLREMLGIYRANTLALIGILGVANIASVITALKVRIEITVPGGGSIGMGIGKDRTGRADGSR